MASQINPAIESTHVLWNSEKNRQRVFEVLETGEVRIDAWSVRGGDWDLVHSRRVSKESARAFWRRLELGAWTTRAPLSRR